MYIFFSNDAYSAFRHPDTTERVKTYQIIIIWLYTSKHWDQACQLIFKNRSNFGEVDVAPVKNDKVNKVEK